MRMKVVDARWANRRALEKRAYRVITDQLREIDDATGHRLVGGVPLSRHWSRRFEYPWALLTTGLHRRDAAPRRVADYGAGLNPVQFYLAERLHTVHSFDRDMNVVERLNSLSPEIAGGRILAFHQDLINLRLREKYDYAFCISVLEHIGDIGKMRKAVDAVCRSLKAGGTALFTWDVSDGDRHLTWKEFKDLTRNLGVEAPRRGRNVLRSDDTEEGRLMGEGLTVFCLALRKLDGKGAAVEVQASRGSRFEYFTPLPKGRRFLNVNWMSLHDRLKGQGWTIRRLGEWSDAEFILIRDWVSLYREDYHLDEMPGVKCLLMADLHPLDGVSIRRRAEAMRRWGLDLVLSPYLQNPLMDFYRLMLPDVDFRLFPWWIDPEVFKPPEDGERDIDVAMLGRLDGGETYPLRRIINDELTEMSAREGFVYHPPARYTEYIYDAGEPTSTLDAGRYADTLRRTKILIFGNSVHRYPLFKYFEGMACGCLVMAPTPYGAEEMGLKPGVNYVPIDSGNFADKVRYYLENGRLRRRIADEGCRLVHREHTLEKRVGQLKKIVKEAVG